MLIRTRMGISADGFIATPDGLPAFLSVPGFTPHGSYDWPVFSKQIEAVVMGRAGLDAGLGSGDWPWPGKQVYVLTSRPLPADVPADVVVADGSPEGLLGRLRAARLTGDAFLLGGQRTLHAFLALGAIDELGLLKLPVLLGEGVPFSLPGAPRHLLRLEQQQAFADGAAHPSLRVRPVTRDAARLSGPKPPWLTPRDRCGARCADRGWRSAPVPGWPRRARR
jgi:dihydrofolate reductase